MGQTQRCSRCKMAKLPEGFNYESWFERHFCDSIGVMARTEQVLNWVIWHSTLCYCVYWPSVHAKRILGKSGLLERSFANLSTIASNLKSVFPFVCLWKNSWCSSAEYFIWIHLIKHLERSDACVNLLCVGRSPRNRGLHDIEEQKAT